MTNEEKKLRATLQMAVSITTFYKTYHVKLVSTEYQDHQGDVIRAMHNYINYVTQHE